MDNIAQQLLADKFAPDGLIDVYLSMGDTLKNRHPGDNCVVELKVPEEVLSNSRIYGLYAMIAGTELCKYLTSIYPLKFILAEELRMEQELAERCCPKKRGD